MLTDWLASLSITMTGVVTFAIMLAAAAAGRSVRLAQVRRSGPGVQESGESVAQEGYLLGATLGLLGLLLAFTFGMVLSRYEARRALATQEANAIGTSYLRAQLLDEPHRSRLSGLLIAYTENRIRLAGHADEARFLAVNDRLLTEIWSAVAAARESALAHGLSTAVLMTYNEVIDLDTERKLAWNLRTPAEVLLLLLLYLAVTAAVVGHSVDGPRGQAYGPGPVHADRTFHHGNGRSQPAHVGKSAGIAAGDAHAACIPEGSTARRIRQIQSAAISCRSERCALNEDC